MSYKIPSITADGILLKDNQILLVQRKNEPFKGKWALPGGFVEYGEKTEDTVVREVFEETGLKTKIRELAGVYSDPKRDPRGHTITVVYILERSRGKLKAGDDASDVKFFKVNKLPVLSFDHNVIINEAIQRFVV
jgi:8-oxo-dGTP diphosphatase